MFDFFKKYKISKNDELIKQLELSYDKIKLYEILVVMEKKDLLEYLGSEGEFITKLKYNNIVFKNSIVKELFDNMQCSWTSLLMSTVMIYNIEYQHELLTNLKYFLEDLGKLIEIIKLGDYNG